MVASPERPELVAAALPGSFGDACRPCVRERASRLDVVEILLASEAALADDVSAPLGQHATELVVGQLEAAGATVAHRDRATQLVDQGLEGADVGVAHVGREKPDAAVDVEPDAAGRDDAIRPAGRRHTADREAIALVHVGHAHGPPHDAGERGDVDELLEAPVVAHRFEQSLVGDDADRHPHVGAVGTAELPDDLADSFERESHLLSSRHTSSTRVASNRPGGSSTMCKS